MRLLLLTINAKYIHASLGLRYLIANLPEAQQKKTDLLEFTLESQTLDMLESILAKKPDVVGISVYIWNVVETGNLVRALRRMQPHLKIVLGGPEVSFFDDLPDFTEHANHIVAGAGDNALPELLNDLSNGITPPKLIKGNVKDIKSLNMPYHLYSDDDIKNRVLYVEASRGCPFKCEFCLSSLDKTSYPFDLDVFLEQMDSLYQRGARHFKFVDRTFNLKVKNTLTILDFFLERMDDELFLHFEVIPDNLPDALKDKLSEFPLGTLQFEVGIQSFDPIVQDLISRRQNNDKSKQNLRWLKQQTTAHIHADLIFGLPGETLKSFENSFNELYECAPHEIQVGILKRLRGTPVIRHENMFQLIFNPSPPYNILTTRDVDFATMQRINRFARYWDMLGNSGRFKHTLRFLIQDSPFEHFDKLADWLYTTTNQTHKIALKRLFNLMVEACEQVFKLKKEDFIPVIIEDFIRSGQKAIPELLAKEPELKGYRRKVSSDEVKMPSRQARHL
jgi:radical SAM superfamily enzyme YgiQ (UPF0313 family)